MDCVVLAFMVLPFLAWWGTPTRVFLEKRLQGVENKGSGYLEMRKEALSDWKQGSNGIWKWFVEESFGAEVENSRRSIAYLIYSVNTYFYSTSILRLDTIVRMNLQTQEKKGVELTGGGGRENGPPNSNRDCLYLLLVLSSSRSFSIREGG
jgi:hypothetical protein